MKLSEENKKRHFCSTAFVVNSDKLLLVNHRKLKLWLPVGGHMEENETPDQAVKREVKEESGLDVEIITDSHPDFTNRRIEILSKPFVIALQDIDEEHQHIDLQFLCRLMGDVSLSGTEECQWFTAQEIDRLENCPDEIKHFGKEAIKIVKSLKQ